MKVKILVILLLFSLTFSAFSQQAGSFKISYEESENSKDPKILNIVIDVGSSLSKGMFIDLPPKIKPAIRSIKLDGNELWLINSPAIVEKENVVGWFTKDNGIVVHNNIGLNGKLSIQIVFDLIQLNKTEHAQVSIYSINRLNQEIQIENTIYAQSDIPVSENSQPDKN